MNALFIRNYFVVAIAGVFCLLITSVVSAQTATDLNCNRCVNKGEIRNNTVSWLNMDGAARGFLINQANTVNGFDRRLDQNLGAIVVSTISVVSDISSSVAGAQCPAGRLVMSANCSCDSVGGTRNFGVLFGCGIAGNGAIVGCFPEAGTFNPILPPPQGEVTAVCLNGRANNGTPLLASPVNLSLSTPGRQASIISGASGNQKSLPSSVMIGSYKDTELDAALISLQNQVLDYSTALQERQR